MLYIVAPHTCLCRMVQFFGRKGACGSGNWPLLLQQAQECWDHALQLWIDSVLAKILTWYWIPRYRVILPYHGQYWFNWGVKANGALYTFGYNLYFKSIYLNSKMHHIVEQHFVQTWKPSKQCTFPRVQPLVFCLHTYVYMYVYKYRYMICTYIHI